MRVLLIMNMNMNTNMKKFVNRETIAYIIFGVFTTIVYFLTRFAILKFTGNSLLSVVVAQFSAILFAYITNKIFVFKDTEWGPINLLKQFTKFTLGRMLVFALDITITFVAIVQFQSFFIRVLFLDRIDYELFIFDNILTNNFIGSPQLLNEFLFAMLVQVLAIILNYIISKKAIFNK